MFKCHECGKEFKDIESRDKHSLEHRIVLISLTADELNRLLLFIMSCDKSVLTPELTAKLYKHTRA